MFGPTAITTKSYSAWNCPALDHPLDFDSQLCPKGVDLRVGGVWSFHVIFERRYQHALSLVARFAHLPHGSKHEGGEEEKEVGSEEVDEQKEGLSKHLTNLPSLVTKPFQSRLCSSSSIHCYRVKYLLRIIPFRSSHPDAAAANELLPDANDETKGGGNEEEPRGVVSWKTSKAGVDELDDEGIGGDVTVKEFEQDVVCRLQFGANKEEIQSMCDPIVVIDNFPRLAQQFGSYQIGVQLTSQKQKLGWMGDTLFEVKVKNENFAIFQSVALFGFLTAALVTIVFFLYHLRIVPFPVWSDEQRWTVLLLGGLVGFNDPLFVLSFVKNYSILSLISSLLRASFFCVLFVFWLILLEGISMLESKQGGGRRKCAFAVVLWVSSSGYFIAQHAQSYRDPFFGQTGDWSLGLLPCYVALILCLVVYLWWLARLLAKGCRELRLLPYRYKVLYASTVLVILLTVSAFVSGALGPSVSSAAGFIAFRGLLNLYVIFLAILFLPVQSDRIAVYKHDDLDDAAEAAGMMRQTYGRAMENTDDASTGESEDDEEQEANLKAAWKHLQTHEDFQPSDSSDEDHQETAKITAERRRPKLPPPPGSSWSMEQRAIGKAVSDEVVAAEVFDVRDGKRGTDGDSGRRDKTTNDEGKRGMRKRSVDVEGEGGGPRNPMAVVGRSRRQGAATTIKKVVVAGGRRRVGRGRVVRTKWYTCR
eukprot:GHVS01064251.1.p1 GENE.GHVS01064251.1~~GHVS01064251.1.p1  ORF type:complete len:730 (+),score=115.88 GHVS01064251.1:84-2192(+)